MTFHERYPQEVFSRFESILSQKAALSQAAQLIVQRAQGGILHTFGSGHSSLVAAEIVGRSGALVPVNQIIDRSEDLAERLEDMACN
ncbi:MAG: SIS domain-containing protein [Deinococcales bacterium]